MAIDSNKARKKIEAVHDLPTLPTVVTEIIGMTSSPKTNAADVGHMIEQDQALTAKVLKLVNSSFYGFPGQIKSIQHAVVILGFNKVKNVVMTASVFDLAKGRAENQLNLREFWKHSLGAAIGSKTAAAAFGAAIQPDDAFVGGLIHDLGKLIMDQFLAEDFAPVLVEAEKRGALLVDTEKELLGFTHSAVGGWIAEKWRLPPGLQHAIKHHHAPAQARDDREMVSSVHLGDIFSRALGIGNGGDKRIPEINQQIWQLANLDYKFLDKSLETMMDELKKAGDFFDMIES